MRRDSSKVWQVKGIKNMEKGLKVVALILSTAFFIACNHPQPGPDKTLAGAVMGAGWGAGTGAIVGHQVSHTGEGAAIGSGIGLAAGAMAGYADDAVEDGQIKLENELASLKVTNQANNNQLAAIQDKLDRSVKTDLGGGVQYIYFDEDETSLKPGAIADLERYAELLKTSTHALHIHVEGHTDDAGTPDYNKRLAEARARNVGSYLAARGISMDQIVVQSFGSARPVASNSTPTGRQLNRRVEVYLEKM
jgi:outer membrane protein OmpA-like peptidoglycan-associated protein